MKMCARSSLKHMTLFMTLTMHSGAALSLSPLQRWAHDYAKQHGGVWSDTLTAILAQEQSYCGGRLGDKGHSGCGQLGLATAQMFDPYVTEADLRFDRARNIDDASAYLDYCMAQTDSWQRGVACYRYGLPSAKKMSEKDLRADPYVRAIRGHLKDGHVEPKHH